MLKATTISDDYLLPALVFPSPSAGLDELEIFEGDDLSAN